MCAHMTLCLANLYCFSFPFFLKSEKADAKEVRTALMTAHDNWKLPERRVFKYVKRQKKEKNICNDDDDNRSLTGRVSRGVRGVKKALITSLSRRGGLTGKDGGPPASVVSTGTQESAPSRKKEQMPEQPPVASIAKLAQPVVEKQEEKAAAAVVVPEAVKEEKADKGVDLDKAYEQEEAQENKVGICHACEGCNIL